MFPAVVITLFSVISFSSLATKSDLITPQNTVVLEKSPVNLRCRSDQTSSTVFISWIYYNSYEAVFAGVHQIIYNGDMQVRVSSRFAFTRTLNGGQVDLNITSVRLTDAGIYSCEILVQNGQKRSRHSAYLTVIASNSKCSMISNTTEHEIGDQVSVECTVGYQGSWPPSIRWENQDQRINDSPSVEEHTIKSTLTRTVKLEDNATVFVCRIFFENQSINLGPGFANNVPTYSSQCTSPTLNVVHPRPNVTVSSGSEVSPTSGQRHPSRSNSAETIHWRNPGTYEVVTNSRQAGQSEHKDIEHIKTAMVIMASVLVIVVLAMAFVIWCFVKTHRKMSTSNTVEGTQALPTSGMELVREEIPRMNLDTANNDAESTLEFSREARGSYEAINEIDMVDSRSSSKATLGSGETEVVIGPPSALQDHLVTSPSAYSLESSKTSQQSEYSRLENDKREKTSVVTIYDGIRPS